MALFSAAFGAMLLSIVLWEQGAWGWSALKAGLAIAPGPIMVPLCSFLVAGRLIRRFGPAAVVPLGITVFAAGVAWWALAITLQPDYAGSVLGGHDAHRDRRRAHPADADGDRGGVAATALLRHRLRRWST